MTTLYEASRIAGLVYIIPAELSYTICQQPKPAPQLKRPRERSSMHKCVSLFRFGFFSIAAMLTASPSAKAESYTLPGESSQPSAEEFIGTRGLVGIYYGHLPRDGHPRQKVTLVLLADPESDTPKAYVLERIGVAKMPNARVITKGSWKLIQDPNRPAAVIYELDAEAPPELRDFWEVDKSTLLVLEKDLRVRRSGFGDPYTVAYALYGFHCNPGQRMRDCSHE
jgi:hypothetical protein